ncbi:glycine-rich domain-containing protein [Herminiimonas contaminans]|uniref:Glycine-rich domain-containing protein n=1 Tax=Herminiimonas contaminans TaxID=1111140 RepID=A0ABS0ESI3_9BURK|nr:hypothetical protein [Herminiimonas contaminans]MBF8177802.1 hypothetical protein [Herminiimonas contaminans]
MTVQSTNNKVFALGDGVTREIPYGFRIYRESDFVVIQTDLLTGIDSAPLILHTDYEVTGAGGYNGGNIVLTNPAPLNTRITGIRLLSTTQLTDLRNQGSYFAEIHEDVFDRLAMVGQQQQEQIDRSFKLPVSVSDVSAELPRPVPGRGLKWSADGTKLINSDVDPDSLASAAAASAQDAANSAFSANVSLNAVIEVVNEVENARLDAEASASEAEASAASINPTNLVHRTGGESIAGIKTFTDSPIVPTPTTANQATNKSYVDGRIGRLIGFQVITATGTYTKATNNPAFVVVEVQGGGGGGGGSAATSSASAGGGAGGYGMKKILASALAASETVTIGNGGTAGAVGGTGGNGGASSFGSHVTCSGGGGGAGSASVGSLVGGAGGVSTGADLNCVGNPGGRSNTNQSVSNGYNASGEGGASRFGGAGFSVANGSDMRGGNGAANSGSGGGGSATNAAGQLGSTGGSGVVIVWEYA